MEVVGQVGWIVCSGLSDRRGFSARFFFANFRWVISLMESEGKVWNGAHQEQ